jgi:hypothetical protein
METTEQDSGVRVHKCGSWNEFASEVRITRFAGWRVFRGQRDVKWKLSSMWERWLLRLKGGDPNRSVRDLFSEGAYEKIRDSYLDRFKDYAIGLPKFSSVNLNNDKDWWALGRHHGLITPLLDWTKSPYIAAFFAFISYAEYLNPGLKFGSEPVAVWELVVDDKLLREGEFEVFTSLVDDAYRQKAQQGVFTYLAHDVHVDLESYLNSRGLGRLLARYEIPGQEMGRALSDLKLMNIAYASLFPDLDGAADQANLWPTLSVLGLSVQVYDKRETGES